MDKQRTVHKLETFPELLGITVPRLPSSSCTHSTGKGKQWIEAAVATKRALLGSEVLGETPLGSWNPISLGDELVNALRACWLRLRQKSRVRKRWSQASASHRILLFSYEHL